jgi:hypothetical protein
MTALAPDNVFERWAIRFPDAKGRDPRGDGTCRGCGLTFAWRGYDGLCGWCEWYRMFRPELFA